MMPQRLDHRSCSEFARSLALWGDLYYSSILIQPYLVYMVESLQSFLVSDRVTLPQLPAPPTIDLFLSQHHNDFHCSHLPRSSHRHRRPRPSRQIYSMRSPPPTTPTRGQKGPAPEIPRYALPLLVSRTHIINPRLEIRHP